jgi:transcriptional regulator with XRE-family HTH domain
MCIIGHMPRKPEPEPGEWAQAINGAVRHLLVDHNLNGQQLAELIERSTGYVSLRLRGKATFTLNDIDNMGKALGFRGGEFLASIETPTEIALKRIAPVTQIHRGVDLLTVPLDFSRGAASTMKDSEHLTT